MGLGVLSGPFLFICMPVVTIRDMEEFPQNLFKPNFLLIFAPPM